MKILAIDFGTKFLGFAVGDSTIKTAAPIDPITRKNQEKDFQYIKQLIDEYDISRIIIGYPLNMDGTKSETTLQVEQFAGQLKANIDIETEFADERLTSFEAHELLKSRHPGYKKRKKILDSVSALIILRSYMESENRP
jgi:putative Holliday junction resolvase